MIFAVDMKQQNGVMRGCHKSHENGQMSQMEFKIGKYEYCKCSTLSSTSYLLKSPKQTEAV